MRIIRFGCVVEGPGDQAALPELLRRVVKAIRPDVLAVAKTPLVVTPGQFLKMGAEFETALEQAARNAGPDGPVLVLLDSEGSPPCVKAPEILKGVSKFFPRRPHSVVLAHHEFETWFLAAAESLNSWDHLASPVDRPPNPEAIQGAKERIARHLPRGMKYSERVDQRALTRLFDIHAARQNSPSFDKLWREVERLLTLCCC